MLPEFIKAFNKMIIKTYLLVRDIKIEIIDDLLDKNINNLFNIIDNIDDKIKHNNIPPDLDVDYILNLEIDTETGKLNIFNYISKLLDQDANISTQEVVEYNLNELKISKSNLRSENNKIQISKYNISNSTIISNTVNINYNNNTKKLFF